MVVKGVPACSAVGGTVGTETERQRGKALAMRVCDGLSDGTDKIQSPGGVRGGVVVNNNIPPLNHRPKGCWHRSIGSAPKSGNWALVAENSGWWLLVDKSSKAKAWRKLKLGSKVVRAGGANFGLLWNGETLASNTEHELLVERCPEVKEWVIAKLVEAHV
jgi:hypothetical protein